jgi:hypothetical protein
MPDYPSISKQQPAFPAYLDFQVLRGIGIDHVQALSSQLWTDFNPHDPGLTILEVLCYAITDLGYRNNLDIQDLLALNPQDPNSRENNFFTPDQVLTCNPVTELDLRKRLIDIAGVRNAWLKKVEDNYEPAIYVDCQNSRLQYTPPEGQPEDQTLRLTPRGLYTLYLDFDLPRFQNVLRNGTDFSSPILEEVKAVLCSYRNLCEDFQNIVVLKQEEIALCSDIELEGDADPEDVLVEIYVRVQEFLAPRVQFYTLQELLAKGKTSAEIFAGRPASLHDSGIDYDSHGFIDLAELEKLTPPTVLHTSDFYQEIGKVSGVAAIRKLSIASYIDGERQSKGELWCLSLNKERRPVLGIDYSTITFFKGNLPFRADANEVKQRYYRQQSAYIKVPLEQAQLDLPVLQGNYYNLAEHYSIHHDFPLTYGIGAEGLPGTVPPLRKAQARQLKGYLVFFDQLLANYLVQLAHVRDLFSWEIDIAQNQGQLNGYDTRPQDLQRTYFSQILDFPGVKEIVKKTEDQEFTEEEYQEFLDGITEDQSTYQERRNRFLDHLLARFAESFTDYVLLNYQLEKGRRDDNEIIQDKARFLQKYPSLSRDRFRAFNYCDCQAVWDTDNVAGFKKRVCRLLDIEDVRRRSLSHYKVDSGYVFFLDYKPAGLSLRGRQIYETEDRAWAALEKFLPFALNPAFYKRLSYCYFYHYGWEVVDRDGNPLVSYQQYFPTRAERQTALEPLLDDLSERLAGLTQLITASEAARDRAAVIPVSPEDFIKIEQDGEGRFHFWLEIPPHPQETGKVIQFKGIHTYDSEPKAREAANLSLKQIRSKKYYRSSRLRSDDSDAAQKFTYYGFAAIDEEGKVWADTPDYWLTQDERDETLQRWLSQLLANQNVSELTVGTPTYRFEPVGSGFKYVLFDALGTGASANLLVSEGTFPDLESVRSAFREMLSYAADPTYYRRIDDLSPPNIYSFELQDDSRNLIALHLGADGQPIAYATEPERDDMIEKIVRYAAQAEIPQQLEEEVVFGYYFYLTLLEEGVQATLVQLRSLERYPTKILAWEAAGAFAENLRYLRRYVSLTEGETGQSYGLGITDATGNLLAVTRREGEPLATFQQLNQVESLLQIEAIEVQAGETEPQYRFNLVDRRQTVLLQGIQLFANDTLVRECFYHEVLGILFEPEAIARTETNGQFGFQVVTLQPVGGGEIEILAIHPALYESELEREEKIESLLLLLRTIGLTQEQEALKPAYSGWIYDQTETEILLQGTQRYTYEIHDEAGEAEAKRAAWQHGNTLIELAQERENFRLIDDEDENNPSLYGWELTNEAKDLTLAIHYYTTTNEREASIEALQACLDDEGFHLLEHILLRPRPTMMPSAADAGGSKEATEGSALTETEAQTMAPSPDEPQLLPISLKPSDCVGGNVPCRASYDPYSFWIGIVLPYWPVRFRDRNFRNLVERTLRLEAPAHVALRICWVDAGQMYEFEDAYEKWLHELAKNGQPQATNPDKNAGQTGEFDNPELLNALIDILTQLKNVYPEGSLHDCKESGPEENPIILNQTALGTANE